MVTLLAEQKIDGAVEFSSADSIPKDVAWVTTHKLHRQPSEGSGNPLDASRARPVFVVIFAQQWTPIDFNDDIDNNSMFSGVPTTMVS